MPKRIQRKRTKGWRMPEGAVYVGRPGPFANMHRIGFCPACQRHHTAAEAVAEYREDINALLSNIGVWPELDALRDEDLACWCPLDQPCHADVLLEIANS